MITFRRQQTYQNSFRQLIFATRRSSPLVLSARNQTNIQSQVNSVVIILGILMSIICLMPSTWKVYSTKWQSSKHGRDDALLSFAYLVHGSASEVNRLVLTHKFGT